MPEWSTIWLFLAAATILVIVPGPNVLYIITRGVHQGRSAGLVSALGVETATLIHVAAATLGLSAILASSAMAFTVVKYAGAAYLIYLGVRTLLSREQAEAVKAPAPMDLGRIYCLLAVLGLTSDIIYALAAGSAGSWLKGNSRFQAAERWVSGTVYIGLGMTAAFAGSDSRK